MSSTLIVQNDPFTAQVKLFEKTKLRNGSRNLRIKVWQPDT